MKVSDVFKAIKHLYIETAPLIYYVETNPMYVAKMDVIIEYIETNLISAMASTITLTEVLTLPLKHKDKTLENEYRDILLHSGGFQLFPVTHQIASLAADLRARYNLRTPDAIHVATGIEAGCDAFLTNDKGIKRVKELKVIVLDDLDL